MGKELSLEEYNERYIKPAVKGDPVGCMVLLRECGYWICKNCTNWTPWTPECLDYYTGYGECVKAEYQPDPIEDEDFTPMHAHGKSSMIYWDMEGYSATFLTRKDFGCILFQEREVPVVKEATD